MESRHSGPLTWAQQEWFADLGAQVDSASLAAANSCVPFPGHRVTVPQAKMAVYDVVARHEGLRTLMECGPDGHWTQAVCNADGVEKVIRVAAEGPAADAALADAKAAPFRLDTQWPLAIVLHADGDTVTRISAIVDHAAIDAWGWKVLGTDLETALSARASGRRPFEDAPPVEQPLDSARWESGPDGDRQARRADRFWHRQLADLHAGLGDWTPTIEVAPAIPTLHSYRLATGAAAAAASAVTATTGISASALYLVAFASAIAAIEGAETTGIHMLAANRLTSGVQKSVRKAVMPALIVIPGPDRASFATRLSTTAHQRLDGARHANAEPHRVAALTNEVLGSRRSAGAVCARFNFLDDSVIPARLNQTSVSGDNTVFTDPSVQGRVIADPPRPGGSRYILTVQHQAHAALLILACHADTPWRPAAADMLWHIEDLMVWAASGYAGAAPRFGRAR
jgi:Condensation domain